MTEHRGFMAFDAAFDEPIGLFDHPDGVFADLAMRGVDIDGQSAREVVVRPAVPAVYCADVGAVAEASIVPGPYWVWFPTGRPERWRLCELEFPPPAPRRTWKLMGAEARMPDEALIGAWIAGPVSEPPDPR